MVIIKFSLWLSSFISGYIPKTNKQNTCLYSNLSASQVVWWYRIRLPMQETPDTGSDPWVGKIPWRREWWPTPVFLPGECLGQNSLASYSPWGHKELDMIEGITLWNQKWQKPETIVMGKVITKALGTDFISYKWLLFYRWVFQNSLIPTYIFLGLPSKQ